MSQSASDTPDDVERPEEAAAGEIDDPEADRTDGAETPEIEEDLFEEELRIDGICGVY